MNEDCNTLQNKKSIYKNIYLFIFNSLINNIIGENKYIYNLQRLSDRGFKFYHFDNPEAMFDMLIKNEFYDAFYISFFIFVRDKCFKDIINIHKNMNFQCNEKPNEKIKYVSKKLAELKIIIKSFTKTDWQKNDKKNKTCNLKTIYDDSHDERLNNHFEDNIRADILERLHLLAYKHFTIKQLTYIDIELKYINELFDMDISKLKKYYHRIVSQIDKQLIKWHNICENYELNQNEYEKYCENIINKNKIIYDDCNINDIILD